MQKIKTKDLGHINYSEALEIQLQTFNELIAAKINNHSNSDAHVLFLCEHFPVITLGKAANAQNILLSEEALKEKGIDVFNISRGGDVTFHGPGQLTGYPVLDLDFFTTDLKVYMRMLEEVIIQTIAEFSLEGYRIEGATGVWVNSKLDQQPKKIAAFGVKTSRWVTMHGFALNVDVDLDFFKTIQPCGFSDKSVTSMNNELNVQISTHAVKPVLLNNFAKVFNAELIAEQQDVSIDKRNQLKENPFSFKITKENKLIISRNNKQVKIISSKSNADFLHLVKQNADEDRIQLALAKLTGNYKHGNEK